MDKQYRIIIPTTMERKAQGNLKIKRRGSSIPTQEGFEEREKGLSTTQLHG